MANANGTTISFGSAVLGVVSSIQNDSTGAEIDMSGLEDTEKYYEVGQLDTKFTVTTKSEPAGIFGDIDTISIDYPTAGTVSIGTFVCTGESVASEIDAPTMTTYKFARARAGS